MNQGPVIFHRRLKQLIQEKVYGNTFIQILYSDFWGRFFIPIFTSHWIGKIMGIIQNSAGSRRKIAPFVAKYQIAMENFPPISTYPSFNGFFSRQYLPGKITFVQGKDLPSPGEGRLRVFESISTLHSFEVKGGFYPLKDLLGSENWAQYFDGGTLYLLRLCPVDYHRYHHIDDGEILNHYQITGKLHSVNPIAEKKIPGLYAGNERQVTIASTRHFGTIAYLEVGASMVGKICNHPTTGVFQRGQEKGYFLFGASTVILIFSKGVIQPSEDLRRESLKSIETLVSLGEAIGSAG